MTAGKCGYFFSRQNSSKLLARYIKMMTCHATTGDYRGACADNWQLEFWIKDPFKTNAWRNLALQVLFHATPNVDNIHCILWYLRTLHTTGKLGTTVWINDGHIFKYHRGSFRHFVRIQKTSHPTEPVLQLLLETWVSETYLYSWCKQFADGWL